MLKMMIFCLIAVILQLQEVVVSGFSILNLDNVEILLQPPEDFCSEPPDILAVVHSAPLNWKLRDAIRQSWGSSPGFKTVFLLGVVPEEEDKVREGLQNEFEHNRDIVQGSFIDSYRNMTYKHLLGYRFIHDHCPSAPLILKSDDDQIVDTLHLPLFIETFIPRPADPEDPFLLCQLIPNPKVHRNPKSKWFVSLEDYPHEHYPTYCAGWAYVMNQGTVSAILDAAKDRTDYYWIDDVYVTGILRKEIAKEDKQLRVYNWEKSFLNLHGQYHSQVLAGTYITPELLVCSDIDDPMTFLRLYRLMQKMHEKKFAEEQLYGVPENKEHVRPLRVLKPDEMAPKTQQAQWEKDPTQETEEGTKKDEL